MPRFPTLSLCLALAVAPVVPASAHAPARKAETAPAPAPDAGPEAAPKAEPGAEPAAEPEAKPDPEPEAAPEPTEGETPTDDAAKPAEDAPEPEPEAPTAAPPRSREGMVAPTSTAPARADAPPPKLTRMEQAGWWTLFGAFALATTAGVLGGLAEREEDKATSLSVRQKDNGSGDVSYADVRGDYEKALDRGETYAKTAIALAAVAGAVAVAGIVIFAVDAGKRRKADERRARLSPGGLEVRF